MRRSVRSTLTVVALTAALALGGVAPANAQLYYKSCTALHKDSKHGVAKSKEGRAEAG